MRLDLKKGHGNGHRWLRTLPEVADYLNVPYNELGEKLRKDPASPSPVLGTAQGHRRRYYDLRKMVAWWRSALP